VGKRIAQKLGLENKGVGMVGKELDLPRPMGDLQLQER
jgi:hypothetical protein